MLHVAEHKTARSTGSVEIRLWRDPASLFFFLRTAIADQNGPFFTQNDHGMTTSLSVELSKLSTSVDLPSLPSPTQLRKAAHTLAPVDTQREREALAGLLNHSPATAATHYRYIGQLSVKKNFLLS